MKRPILALGLLTLAACQTTQPTTVRSGTSDDAHALYTTLTETVKTCWFAGDAAFAGYIYTPEINADAPRIMIVPKADPHGRPVLVIEPKGSASADVYGPLLTSPTGARAKADLDRWIKGSTACA